jgi:hypothetical protein
MKYKRLFGYSDDIRWHYTSKSAFILATGNWQIIGKADAITEDQAKEIVPCQSVDGNVIVIRHVPM